MSELTPQLYRSIEAVNENQWNNVVTQSDRGTLFHRHEWLRALERGFDYDPYHVVVTKKENPVSLLPNFVVNLPLPDGLSEPLPVRPPLKQLVSTPSGHGGPVTVTSEGEALDLLFETVESTVDRTVVNHVIESYDLGNVRYGQYLQTNGYEASFSICLFMLDLREGWEAILKGMDKERRRDVRKGDEQEHKVTIEPLGEDLETTYDWYVKNLERVEGAPVPRSFLSALAEECDDRVRVLRAFVEGEERGRYVHLLDEEGDVLHHWLSAIPDASNYQYHPSELLHKRAIKWGIDEGFERYNFGKTGAHFSNSVFRFKHKYGGAAVPVFKVEKGFSRLVWPLYRFGRNRYVEQSL